MTGFRDVLSVRVIEGTGVARLFLSPDRRLALFWRVLFYSLKLPDDE